MSTLSQPWIGARLLGALNEGLADTAGAPVDLMSAAMRYVGVPTSDTPVLGSRYISNGLHSIGIGQTGSAYAPQSTAERYGQAAARGLGQAALPVSGLFGASVGKAAAGIASSAAKDALDASAARPAVGPFGPIHYDLGGNWQAGLDRLRQFGGEIPDAFDHPSGPIDAIWGAPGKAGYGIAHIESEHGEILNDLDKIIPSLPVESISPNRMILQGDKARALVRLQWDGQAKRWLLTTYPKGR